MSITSPEIDTLLSKTEQNPFLLCTVTAKRACDINNMLRGQHLRVMEAQDFDDITTIASGEDTVSIAMQEINDDVLSFEQEEFDEAIRGANTRVKQNL
ncbi:MAG: DNA-directed RNA polymerase subunit omega [Atopobiaceae bacterium]|nr:DNA-directed RNA polymerase subunit omega [Atopobiaceae bacterium]